MKKIVFVPDTKSCSRYTLLKIPLPFGRTANEINLAKLMVNSTQLKKNRRTLIQFKLHKFVSTQIFMTQLILHDQTDFLK